VWVENNINEGAEKVLLSSSIIRRAATSLSFLQRYLHTTLLEMQRVNKTGEGDSLWKTFNPKWFRTTNFERFRQPASLR
jgi:hypothetical protein